MKNRNYLIAGLFVLMLIASTAAYALWGGESRPAAYDYVDRGSATTTPRVPLPAPVDPTPAPTASSHPYGMVTLRLNETATFPDGLSLRPIKILEDSRCPINARCIQAGTVRVSVDIHSGMGTSPQLFEPGTGITTEAEKITLLSVTPETMVGETIGDGDYRFVFEVTRRGDTGTDTEGCFVGGCSAQLCTDDPDAVSTCEYRAEYACYRTAKCKRQSDGECGWTQTSSLKKCLANPPELE